MISITFTSDVENIVATEHLYQWDNGQKLSISGVGTTADIHFANKKSEKALVVTPTATSGACVAPIPNSLLAEPYPIIAYVYVPSDDGSKTIKSVTINVEARKQPSNFVLTEDEAVITIESISQRANEMIQNATNQVNIAISNMNADYGNFKTTIQSELADMVANTTIPNADTLDGKHASDFVDVNDISTQIEIPSDTNNPIDVPIWITTNGKRYTRYFSFGSSGRTNVPNNSESWVWYYFDGNNLIAREHLTDNVWTAAVVNGVFTGWKLVNSSDADTLDGKHASDFMPISGETRKYGIVRMNESDAIYARHIDGNNTEYDGSLYLNYNCPNAPIYMNGNNTAIHSGNIGSQSVNYANSAGSAQPIFNNSTWYSVGDDVQIGDHNVSGGLGILGTNGHTRIDLCQSGNPSNFKSITFDGTTLNLDGNADTLDGKHASDFASVRKITTQAEVDGFLESGIYSVENVPTVFGSVSSEYYMLIVNRHRTDANYNVELAIPYINGWQQGVYYRNCANGTWGTWTNVADGGNADTLDGKHASDFVDVNDISTQIEIPLDKYNPIDVPIWITTNGKRYTRYFSSGSSGRTNVPNNSETWVWYYFDGFNIIARENNTDNVWTTAVVNGVFTGWKLVNGSDADTLDGKHASDFASVRKITTQEEVDSMLESGIYSVEDLAVPTTFGSIQSTFYMLIVNKYRRDNGDYNVELAIPYINGWQQGVYYRNCANGTWGTWTNVADGGNANTANTANMAGTLATTPTNVCLRNISFGTAEPQVTDPSAEGYVAEGALYGQYEEVTT